MRREGAAGRAPAAVIGLLCALAGVPALAMPSPALAQRADTLGLTSLLERALATHPAARGARARVEAAEAGVGQARAAYLPSLGLGATAARHQEPMVVAPLHGFDPTQPPLFDRTLYQGQLAAGYTLYDGGGRSARARRAAELLDAAGAARREADATLLARTTQAYLDVLTAREVRAAHVRRTEALAAERARVALLLEAGRAARVALLRAQAAESQARAERVRSQGDVLVAERELARLTGLPTETVAGAELAPLAPSPAAQPANGEAAAPAVHRALAEAAAARAGAQEARAALLPRLDLQGHYLGFAGGDVAPVGEWNAGVRVSWPVFTGGARSHAVALATAEAEAAEARAGLERLRVQAELDRAHAAWVAADAQAEALAAAVAQLEEVARIERLALETGAGVQTDYLAAEAALLEARAGLAHARHAASAARAWMAAATGALTPEWARRNLEGR